MTGRSFLPSADGIRRRWITTVTAAVFLSASALTTSCEDGSGFGQLEVAVEASPTLIEIGTLWGGSVRTRNVELRNVGEATATLGTPVILNETGPVSLSLTLAAETIATGTSTSLTLAISAPPDGLGQYVATIEVPVDGADAVTVDVVISVRPAPACDDDNSCTQDRFDLETGECIFDTVPNFVPCDDENACTEADLCLSGRCVGNVIECNDNVGCTIDGCDPDVGCVFEPSPSRCDDENDCTSDLCTPGFGCENPPVAETTLCHFNGCVDIGFCAGPVCIIQEVPSGVPCDDGDACTLNDTCELGVCTPGPKGTPGAATPVELTDGEPLAFTDCLHPNPLGCGALPRAHPEEVLAVARLGPLSAVAFRTAFIDVVTDLPCDPSEQVQNAPVVIELDGGPVDAGSPVPEPPQPVGCVAGVFVAAYAAALPAPINIPETRVLVQVGSVHGPTGAAFGEVDTVSRTARLGLAHYDFSQSGQIYFDGITIGLDGIEGQSREVLQWPEIPGSFPQALVVANTGTSDAAVIGIPDRRGVCIVGCEDPVVAASTQLPVWASQAGVPFSPSPTAAVHLFEDLSCDALTPPLDLDHATFSLEARPDQRLATLSFVASRDACVPKLEPWNISFDIDAVTQDPFVNPIPVAPAEDVDGGPNDDGGVLETNAAVAVSHNLTDTGAVIVEAVDCENAGAAGCRRVVLVTEDRQDVLAEEIGVSFVSAAPFAVDSNHRTALFFGPRAEMRWIDEDQSLRRLPAPSMEDYQFRGDRVAFVRGDLGESLATIGVDLIDDCEPDGGDCSGTTELARKAVILQRFSCGFGVGDRDLGDPCQDAVVCDEGLGCDFEQGCQPPPDCESGPCLQECWGVCGAPEGPCANRQPTMCAADGACRFLPDSELCVPAADCDDDSCPADEICTGVVDECLPADAGCTTARICVSAPDGGVADGGPDGGIDAGQFDAGNDGGLTDGGPADGGTLDGGINADAGSTDAGDVDGGDVDGGDIDGGSTDAGTTDAGGTDGG